MQTVCGNLPLLGAYWRNGALDTPSPDQVARRLHIDKHYIDCGAPDGYGQNIELTLQLRPRGGRCEVARATSRHEPFGEIMPGGVARPWSNEWRVVGAPDFAAPLSELELRDDASEEALLLLPRRYWYYERASPRRSLLRELRSEGAAEGDCCFGYTSTWLHDWR